MVNHTPIISQSAQAAIVPHVGVMGFAGLLFLLGLLCPVWLWSRIGRLCAWLLLDADGTCCCGC